MWKRFFPADYMNYGGKTDSDNVDEVLALRYDIRFKRFKCIDGYYIAKSKMLRVFLDENVSKYFCKENRE